VRPTIIVGFVVAVWLALSIGVLVFLRQAKPINRVAYDRRQYRNCADAC
jgi:hypothetical protein